MRCTQALFSADAVRLQCYVDDPIGILQGSRSDRDRNLAIIVVLWLCLGFPLAFHKAQRGQTVVWIGVSLSLKDKHLEVSLKQDLLDELLST